MNRTQANERFYDWLFGFLNEPAFSSTAEPVGRVYQYTSGGGLIGMLRSNRVWASHAATMNDPGEIRYASAILGRAFDQQCQRTKSQTLARLRGFVENSLSRISGNTRVYLGCFSEDCDLLSQWRAYADDGRGFAVGFDLNDVGADSWIQVGGPAFRRRVIYDEAIQTRIANDIATAARKYVINTRGRPDSGRIGQIQECIVECSVCFKHPSYVAEKEWRAIYIENPSKPLNSGVRERNGLPVPYVELAVPANDQPDSTRIAIREIVIGPANDMESTERLLRDSIRELAGAEFSQSVLIRRSQIPYRRV